MSLSRINFQNRISKEKEIKRDEIKFFYRGSNLPNELVITSVKLKGKKQLKEIIEKNIECKTI